MYCAGAGTGGLGLAVEGPSEAKMTCKDNRDGSCTVEYVPLEAGEYDVSIKYADQHIPGSPFKVTPFLVYCYALELINKCVLHLSTFYVSLIGENYGLCAFNSFFIHQG